MTVKITSDYISTPELIDVRQYDTLSEAVTAIGNDEATLVISSPFTVEEDVTIPENICLKFTKGGKLVINGGYTVTINGAIDAGLWQIFDGDGTVAGSPKIEAVYPEWFGAVGDGEHDDTEAIQRAADLELPVRLAKKIYVITHPIVIHSHFVGVSGRTRNTVDTVIRLSSSFTGDYAIEVRTGATIKDIFVDGNDLSVRLFYFHNVIGPTKMENIWCRYFKRAAFYVHRDEDAKSEDLFFDQVYAQPLNPLEEPLLILDNVNECTFIGCKFWGNAKKTYNSLTELQQDVPIVLLKNNSRGNIFISCSVTYGSYGFDIDTSESNVILGCVLESNKNGIRLDSSTGEASRFNEILANRIFQTGDISGGNPGHAIYVNNGSFNKIEFKGDSTQPGDVYLDVNSEQNFVLVRCGTAGVVLDNGTDNFILHYGYLKGDKRYFRLPDAVMIGDNFFRQRDDRNWWYVKYGWLDILDEIGMLICRFKGRTVYPQRLAAYTIPTFSDGDTTPSVADSNIFKTNNSSTTSITTFDNGVAGQEITIIFGDSNTTIVHGSGIYLKGGANITLSANTTMKFVYDGSYWYEV